MRTDNWPVDFRYISRRLVTEIVQQHEAGRPRQPWAFSLPLRIFTVTLERRAPDYGNLFDLARRATESVSENTGTLADFGPYVMASVELHHCWFPIHQGWVEGSNHEVAAFFSDTTRQDSGRTLIALFGSVGNYLGRRPEPEQPGWTPSDAAGLYAILDATREPTDSSVKADYLWDDGAMTMVTRYDVARRFNEQMADRFPAEPAAFLARAYSFEHDVDLRDCRYDTVLLGAPVWIATPHPTPLGS